MRTSSSRLARRRGFSLLEMTVAIAAMALVVAIVVPNMRRALSQNALHTTFFEFQNQATELRARAFREKQALVLVDSGRFVDDPEADPSPVEIKFLDGRWTYRLSEPLVISAGGLCNLVTAEVLQDGREAMRLESQADCSFRRVQ